MKIECNKDGKLIIIAESGADEFLLNEYLPENGGGAIVETWGNEFVTTGERRLSITLRPKAKGGFVSDNKLAHIVKGAT